MTMEDKEIKFWIEHPQWTPPYLEECDMDWEKIKADYVERLRREKELGIEKVREKFNSVLDEMTTEIFDEFEEGNIPSSLSAIIDIDPKTGNFVSKEYPDIVIGTIYDIFDAMEENADQEEMESTAE